MFAFELKPSKVWFPPHICVTPAKVIQQGWGKQRSIYPEDVLITLYSTMGIDWTKKSSQTPSGRSFEYIENISPKGYLDFGEIAELFA